MATTRAAALLLGVAIAFSACAWLTDLSSLRSSSDAGPDTGPDASCEATFCDDFDFGPLGATWTDSRGLDAGRLSLGAPAISPPNAFVATLPEDAGDGTESFLIKDLPKGSTLVCGVSIFVDVVPVTAKFVDILSFLHSGSGGFVDADLKVGLNQDGVTLREDVTQLDGGCSCPAFMTTAAPVPLGLFFRLELETDFSVARLSINGAVVASNAVASDPPTAVRVSLGIHGYGNVGAQLRFDDFSCTVGP